jgi:hypothetical protein
MPSSDHHQPIKGTKTWQQVKVTLPHARFAGPANGCDFRLAAQGGDLLVRCITVQRPAE